MTLFASTGLVRQKRTIRAAAGSLARKASGRERFDHMPVVGVVKACAATGRPVTARGDLRHDPLHGAVRVDAHHGVRRDREAVNRLHQVAQESTSKWVIRPRWPVAMIAMILSWKPPWSALPCKGAFRGRLYRHRNHAGVAGQNQRSLFQASTNPAVSRRPSLGSRSGAPDAAALSRMSRHRRRCAGVSAFGTRSQLPHHRDQDKGAQVTRLTRRRPQKANWIRASSL